MKRIFILLFTFLFANPILSLNINITKISPSIVQPNSTIYLQICFINNEQNLITTLNGQIYYPSCFYSSKTQIYVNDLGISDTYCVPLTIYENCNLGTYFIVLNGSYTSNTYKTFSYVYPITVYTIPYIYIKSYTYVNNYYGEISDVIINIETTQPIYNVYIISNSTICPVSSSSYYIKEIENTYQLFLSVKIPTNIYSDYCIIPLEFIYQDQFGNKYNSTLTINIPANPSVPSIEIFTNTTELNIGENSVEFIFYNPSKTNIRDLSISIPILNSTITINLNRTYINELNSGERKIINAKIFVPYGNYGTISIPFILTFISNSNKYTINQNHNFKINVEPNVSLSAYYSSGTIIINVYNNGSSPAYNLQIFSECEGCIVIPSKGFVGELDPQNSNSVILNLIKGNENSTLNIIVEYQDYKGNVFTEKYIYNLEELGYIGYSNKNRFSIFSISEILIIIIIMAIILYFILKKRKNEAE